MTARALIVIVFFMGIALRSSAVDLTELDGVRKRVDALLPELRSGLEIERIKETPVPGLYEVLLNGNRTLYISADGNYFLVGDMYEVSSEGIVNLPELARQEKRKELMAKVDATSMISFKPASGLLATVSVFTDVDCTYCRKLHREMREYHKKGIEVRYLAYPRAGIGSESYKKTVSAWCSSDPQRAITTLKRGDNIPSRTCPNPVAAQYELGDRVGVTGTPSIVLSDGRMLPGYLSAEKLAEELGI